MKLLAMFLHDDGPWFFGKDRSLIDAYLAVMALWRPREDWFKRRTPKLSGIVGRFRETEMFKEVLASNQ